MTPTPFQHQLIQNIRKTIARLKSGGTVVMGLANLCQVTPTPPPYMVGEPESPEAYRQLFEQTVRGNKNFSSFLIYEKPKY